MLHKNLTLIAHRGNVGGSKPTRENEPSYIIEAIEQGFDVEIDVWRIGGHWFLGHDEPTHQICFSFLRNPKLWCHAKNIEALLVLSRIKYINCFWHDKDICCLTSHGYIWSFSECEMTMKSIVVFPKGAKIYIPGKCAGVCCDNIGDLKC